MCDSASGCYEAWKETERANARDEDERAKSDAARRPLDMPIFYRISPPSVVFYVAYGEKHCKNATPWCLEHCCMRRHPFPPEDDKLLQEISSFDWQKFCKFMRWGTKEVKGQGGELIRRIDDIKYMTFFASGTLEELGKDWAKGITKIAEQFDNKVVRFFTRSVGPLETASVPENARIIFSADKDTRIGLLHAASACNNINAIAVVDHVDNAEVIQYCTDRIGTVVKCSDCRLKDGSCRHLCFKQQGRFVLLQNYE